MEKFISMYCKNCGNKLKQESIFCNECGHKTAVEKEDADIINFEQTWWLRLAKVVYIFINGIFIIIVGTVWSDNFQTYNAYLGTYTNDYEKGFTSALFALIFGLIVIRLIKITFFYIFLAKKPTWKKELKRLY